MLLRRRSYLALGCFLFAGSPAHSQQIAGPTGVTAEQTGVGEITIRWNAVPGASEYMISRSVWPNGFQRFVPGAIKATTYTDTDVRPGVKHIYGVTAKVGNGRVTAVTRSNEVIPGGRTRPLDITREARVEGRSEPIPSIDPTPFDTLTPAPDTLSSTTCTKQASERRARNIIQAQRRAGNDTISVPDAAPTQITPMQQAYNEGKCRHGSMPGYPDLWTRAAEISGLPHDSLVLAWKELNTVALLYRHVLQREPTKEEVLRELPRLKRGATEWKRLWRELAHSDERDQRFGYWAPAPLASASAAQQKFGLSVTPAMPQICFGAMGPNCGGAPTPNVSPKWFGHFRLPDGTEFGYVNVGVGVGSVTHDYMCLIHREGLNCDGLGAGDLVKHAGWPAALEWNKATWNVLENRVWRDIFGPYPTSAFHQREFFDDLRVVKARETKLAPILSQLSGIEKTILYSGAETKRTRALKAPPGTMMDDTDAAYCATGQFERTVRINPDRSAFGICGRK
jgi:hypothetical protein